MDNQDEDATDAEIAGACLYVVELIDQAISCADEDEDLSFPVQAREWLQNIADIYNPPGSPPDGYSAPVISLDAWRAKLRR